MPPVKTWSQTDVEPGLLGFESDGSDHPFISSVRVRAALVRWGSQSSAYFVQQQGVRWYADALGGVVPYVRQPTPLGAVNIVFTQPLCDAVDLGGVLARFEASVTAPVIYVGVGEVMRQALQRRGYAATIMGTEFAVDLSSFDLAGRDKKQLRHASHLGARCGVQVKEQSFADIDGAAVQAISVAWRGGKAVSSRELRLLTRPPVMADEWGVRKFFAWQGDTLLGYVFFDPYFAGGEVTGYCANILRARAKVQPAGLLDFVMLEAMRQFQAEGVSHVSLGIAPLHGVRAVPGDQPALRRVCSALYDHGNRLYAFRALAYHKSRYRGVETPWYVCTKKLSVWRVAWAMLMATGIARLGRAR